MKVILRQDVSNLGKAGESHEVTPGYFRNFLQPRGFAIEATSGRLRTQQVRVSHASTKESREVEQARKVAEDLGDLTLTFPVKVGDQGRMYGSVTAKDVADELKRAKDITVDRHKIVISEALRSTGEHTVVVKLEHGVDAKVKVNLVLESEQAG
jgi:large subunit ribosomal protein L9